MKILFVYQKRRKIMESILVDILYERIASKVADVEVRACFDIKEAEELCLDETFDVIMYDVTFREWAESKQKEGPKLVMLSAILKPGVGGVYHIDINTDTLEIERSLKGVLKVGQWF